MLPQRIPKVAYLLLALLAMAGVVAAAMAESAPGRLTVNEVRFLKGPLENGNLTVDAILYLTSLERPSKDVRLEVYFYPRGGGMAEDRQDIAVGTIPGQRTQQVHVPLHLGANATSWWSVDFLVFEDGLLTQRGHGNIGFRGGDVYGALDRLEVEASAGPFEPVR